MAASDAEIMRQMWEEFTAENPVEKLPEFAERWWHPEIVYEEDPKWPGSSTYEGRDAVRAAFEGYDELLGAGELRTEDVIDAGDQVVALIQTGGVSQGADIPWDHLWAYLCRVRDGQLVYLRAYWDPDEALASAGADSP